MVELTGLLPCQQGDVDARVGTLGDAELGLTTRICWVIDVPDSEAVGACVNQPILDSWVLLSPVIPYLL
jgi:hypothetical protein